MVAQRENVRYLGGKVLRVSLGGDEMSRTMPLECEHGRIVDWGDFGPDDHSLPDPCAECEADRLVFYYCDGTKRIYPQTPSHCKRTPFKHKHSRCGWKVLVDRS